MKNQTLFICFLVITFFSCQLPNKQKQGLLWEISGNNLSHSSFLLGTYHASSYILHNFLDSIPGFHTSFNKCTQYIGEVIGDITEEDIQESSYLLFMPKDTLYSDILTECEKIFLDSILLCKLGKTADLLNIRPATLYWFLGRNELWKNTGNENKNMIMDDSLFYYAKRKGYKLIGLETHKDQLELLIKPKPLKEEVETLISNLRNSEKEDYEYLNNIAKAYRDQDLAKLQEVSLTAKEQEDEELQLFFHELGPKRNIKWMEKIPRLIQEHPSFIAVGVSHLPGEKGLINLLRKEGYKVKTVK